MYQWENDEMLQQSTTIFSALGPMPTLTADATEFRSTMVFIPNVRNVTLGHLVTLPLNVYTSFPLTYFLDLPNLSSLRPFHLAPGTVPSQEHYFSLRECLLSHLLCRQWGWCAHAPHRCFQNIPPPPSLKTSVPSGYSLSFMIHFDT